MNRQVYHSQDLACDAYFTGSTGLPTLTFQKQCRFRFHGRLRGTVTLFWKSNFWVLGRLVITPPRFLPDFLFNASPMHFGGLECCN